ncbi:MAG: glycosyltransferase family 1 protein [Candidatus Didemnitutus sp.]|nr:glycosyltransferase family 1 protein [Candidatus Didemnitutus sp.]
MVTAIDASNIRAGGGITHLAECLGALDAMELGLKRVVVFGGLETLARLPERGWLEKNCPPMLRQGAAARFWWRQFELTRAVSDSADVLLVPGGSYSGSFRPYVAFAQNLLPFDAYEKAREGFTLKGARRRLLSWMQTRTFRRADGVIYMTGISQAQIERSMGFGAMRSRVVHHGTNPRFFRASRPARPNSEYTPEKPFRLLYLSILEPYKHQDVVVDAVGSLLQKGVPVALDLVGPGNPQDQREINTRIRRWDPAEGFIKYHGMIPYEALNEVYEKADAFIFASSCETFGIILLEAMAGGLPVICSHRSAMPEVVGNAAVYFDPLHAGSLAGAIRRVLEDIGLRRTLAFQARHQAEQFTWEKCARETFGFVREIHEAHQRRAATPT